MLNADRVKIIDIILILIVPFQQIFPFVVLKIVWKKCGNHYIIKLVYGVLIILSEQRCYYYYYYYLLFLLILCEWRFIHHFNNIVTTYFTHPQSYA